MLKKTLSVIAGIVASQLIIFFSCKFILFKMCPDLAAFSDLHGEFARNRMELIPTKIWFYLILVWCISAFVCGYLIKLISHSSKISVPIGCGAFLTLGAIMGFVDKPHPLWVVLAGLIVFIPMTILGDKVCKTRVLSPEQEALEEEQDLA